MAREGVTLALAEALAVPPACEALPQAWGLALLLGLEEGEEDPEPVLHAVAEPEGEAGGEGEGEDDELCEPVAQAVPDGLEVGEAEAQAVPEGEALPLTEREPEGLAVPEPVA